MAKICCGGFYLGEGLELDGRTLKVTGGSGGNVPDPEVADIGKVLGIVEDVTGAKYAPVDASGLPDPSALTDGTAMVAVNGEWKMQEGYGYTGEPAFEPIEWDGNTEGRAYFATFYKVSDSVIPADDIIGASFIAIEGEEEFTVTVSSIEQSDGLYTESNGMIYVASNAPVEVPNVGTIPENGVYFYSYDGSYISSLTPASTVHQFDPALIPTSGGGIAVNLELAEDEEEGIIVTSADKTVAEVISAVQSGSSAVANLWFSGSIYMSFSFYQYQAGSVSFGYFWDATHTRPSAYVTGTNDGVSDEWIIQGLSG